MSVHVLKCLPEYFDQVLSGEKRFEIRVDDRGYKVGDILFLDRRNPDDEYTERLVAVRVVGITRLTDTLLQLLGMTATKPVVIMSIAPVELAADAVNKTLSPLEAK